MDREKIRLLTGELYGLLSMKASDQEIEKKIEELANEREKRKINSQVRRTIS